MFSKAGFARNPMRIEINFNVEFLRKDDKKEKNIPLSMMVSDFKYIADRIGVKHVAIGSDFAGTANSDVIKDVTGFLKLVQLFLMVDFMKMRAQKFFLITECVCLPRHVR